MLSVCFLLVAPTYAQKQYINPSGDKPPGYTHVVVSGSAGKTLYIAGQVALNEKGEVVGRGDLGAQTQQVFENLKKALAAAGATFDDVVKMTTYIVNYQPEHVAILRQIRQSYLNMNNPPANTLVGVQALYRPELLIEIEAIATIP